MTFELTHDGKTAYVETAVAARGRHPMWGKRGPVYVDKYGEVHVWQDRGEDIRRGRDRKGIKAKDFMAEAVYDNETTSARFEVPRVVIDTMRLQNPVFRSGELAVYWFLFANARNKGIDQPTHTITIASICRYLGIASVDRVISLLKRLAASDATVSYHFNQPGWHGRKTVKLIDIVIPEGKVKGRHEIEYSLPEGLRTAVLDSRDYAWIDINVLTRLKSKFSFPAYFKLCLKAGQLAEKRTPFATSEATYLDFLGIPAELGQQEINHRLDAVVEDLKSISGVRKRFDFDFEFERFTKKGVRCIRLTAGTAAKKLREVQPCSVTKAYHRYLKAQFLVPAARMPHITRVRQASTLADVPIKQLFEAWWIDTKEAADYGTDVIGLEGSEFIAWLDRLGPDRMLEHWVEQRDFGDLVRGKAALDRKAESDKRLNEHADSLFVGTTVAKPATEEDVPDVVAEQDIDDDDTEDLRLGDDFDTDDVD